MISCTTTTTTTTTTATREQGKDIIIMSCNYSSCFPSDVFRQLFVYLFLLLGCPLVASLGVGVVAMSPETLRAAGRHHVHTLRQASSSSSYSYTSSSSSSSCSCFTGSRTG
ncbi:hypothetical protein Pcinc_020184 [Petrolisthes cinctipes]|uniref:Uncharacterized protein n=1 Tax=Petrolisthes cinctipes TaxID=88211 RepID=A0AAE1FJJ0_PETCI|nr:hypothetical protein Pcinc_020184 [Petrolisthes cinctipes]